MREWIITLCRTVAVLQSYTAALRDCRSEARSGPAEVRANPTVAATRRAISFVPVLHFRLFSFVVLAYIFALSLLWSAISLWATCQIPEITTFLSFLQTAPPPRPPPPTLCVAMAKPAVLLIGGITHAKKEWEECASFATLKVSPSPGI
jgi:hypothetical protein